MFQSTIHRQVVMLKVLLILSIFCSFLSLINGQENHYYCTLNRKCVVKDFANVEDLEKFCNGIEYPNSSYGLSNIQIFELKNVSITHLPQVCLRKFSSINTLIASDAGIEEIKKEDFESLLHLRYLDLSKNKIKILEKSIFKNLIEIDLSHNLIEVVHPEVFNETTSYVKNVKLSHNQIKEFDEKILENVFMKLKHSCKYSFSLQLDNNKIEKFLPYSGSCKLNYQRCGLADQNIKVNLSDNFLTSIESNCEITTLDLSRNPLDLSKIDLFGHLESIRKLLISQIGLKEIPFGFFGHVKALKYLDISYNQLTKIDYHKFSTLDNLQMLNVSHNNLHTIDDYEDIKKVLPNLRQIALEGNSWDCTYLSKMKIYFNVNEIELINALNPVKNKSNVFGIECSEGSEKMTTEVLQENNVKTKLSDLSNRNSSSTLMEKIIQMNANMNKTAKENQELKAKLNKIVAASGQKEKNFDKKQNGATVVEIFIVCSLLLIAIVLIFIAYQAKIYVDRKTLQKPKSTELISNVISFENQENSKSVDFLVNCN